MGRTRTTESRTIVPLIWPSLCRQPRRIRAVRLGSHLFVHARHLRIRIRDSSPLFVQAPQKRSSGAISRSRPPSRSRSFRHLPSTRFLAVTPGCRNRDFGPMWARKNRCENRFRFPDRQGGTKSQVRLPTVRTSYASSTTRCSRPRGRASPVGCARRCA
jgi:hypothetical protein